MKNLLIVATSGRMLAQFSVNIDINPLVIDCFSDTDTQALAIECIKVDGLTLDNVKMALSTLMNKYSITHVLYGSGLECYLETLAFLNQQFILLGNSFATFSAIQDKQWFFNKLTQINIPYPETRFTYPVESNHWLTKPLRGEGGIGIKKTQQATQQMNSIYWQKYQLGQAMSVLFVADGCEFQVIGFNKQFVTSIEDHEFVFLSVISQPEITRDIVCYVTGWLKKIVIEFSLIGINSLDFILHQQQCYFLEINPRPSASMQLYGKNLLAHHLNAVNFISMTDSNTYQGYQIVFADEAFSIRKNIVWPNWVFDRPQQGTYIYTGTPICSIIAAGEDEQQVQGLLFLKQHSIKKLLR